ncbi:BaiN/RdsA family NAD(P)/FAD-dependent oxidoreductase [Vallitalea guaymasensis]|uniref:NAD(P)/FAD-dependent oxidoreductase n=1 Tax=Vallitalea guaymasensis TaxID=1185412 RepID=A0A8J8SEM8_9FIRM|nr:NAD(P)/FAD-dependent oxidoreductase [Vallitalea guaymasensis]QUH31720.1 NAD(P)/FAD-dependent oxidoreductase [Vallitalea guaymasensis]
MAKNKIVIIGGGASGLVAAIVAARNGAKVTILERKDRIGKKILATGNGRCNLTNMHCSSKYFHGGDKDFITNILEQFDVNKTLEFFSELGIYPINVDSGKVYPNSLQASSVLDVLRLEVDRLKINIECNAEVTKIERSNNFVVYTKDKKYYGNKIIIAAGGKSSPDLGSNGSGFTLAKSLGHTIKKPIPSLVQLKSGADFLKQIKGVKINALAKIIDENNEIMRKEYGEILFTDYGISGPPILQISRIASDYLNDNKRVSVDIDFFHDLSEKELDQILLKRLTSMPNKTIQENFIGFINKRLINIIIKEAGIAMNKKSADIKKEERNKLVSILKKFSLIITGTNQWNQSQVTAGGIITSEIDEVTLESKKVKDVYLAGEVIDVDGDCGGYNLQWAWSSGVVAGMNASN